MKIKGLITLLFCMSLISVFSCKESDAESDTLINQRIIKPKEASDVLEFEESKPSSIELTLSRGAFHYDAFQLKESELTYLPSKDAPQKGEFSNFNEESTVQLSDSTLQSLINELLENEIFKLDSVYESNTSCNSKLELYIKIDDEEKRILSSDFQRNCPKVLSDLEDKLIKLHGKNLKRVLLPG